jgi:hypothetical protein
VAAAAPCRTPVRRAAVSFRDEIRPVRERRCIVCHGCCDARCQLELDAWWVIARGTSEALVYDAIRLDEAAPTGLFIDAQRPSQWRRMGPTAVLNERSSSPENNLAASVHYRSLVLKRAHPLPAGEPVLSDAFGFSLSRSQSCPSLGEFDRYAGDPRWTSCPTVCPASTSASTAC